MAASASLTRVRYRVIILFLIPFASCIASAIAGVIVGQAGNLFYAVIGDAADVVCIPAYCLLFFLTAGISYLINALMKKWYQQKDHPAKGGG